MIVLIGSSTGTDSGKDSVANVFEKRGFVHLKFSDPVKEITAILLNCDKEKLEDRVFKESPLPENLATDKIKTVRDLMVFIGTTSFRGMYKEDIWVQVALTRIEPNINYVISDARFLNEYEILSKENIVTLVIVDKPNNSPSSNTIAEQESVLLKEKADYIIINDGTLGLLENKADKVCEHILRYT